MNQTLAVAYRNQIRNGNTWLFAESGKPEFNVRVIAYRPHQAANPL
ncbi:MAG: hypothetical protein WAN27_11815 [Xanthobacteraceae bacterium]|jgi:hypothetical protein